MKNIEDLMQFLDASPVNFLAAKNICLQLDSAGFTRLDFTERWQIKPSGKYYVTKNDSAVFAFIAAKSDFSKGCKIICAHSDSPCFRIKPHAAIKCDGNIVKLNTEVYGGPILYTWFDRPLSIAGRVILRSSDPLCPRTALVNLERPLLTIPHLAIHFNRAVNDGNPLSKQKDMLPVLGVIKEGFEKDNILINLVAEKLGVQPSEILDFDLSLYDTTKACLLGLNNEFITSGRLDDLSMVHASLKAICEAKLGEQTKVMAIFDNEETGSGTKQGAASPMLDYVLRRVANSLNADEEDYMRGIANSFMISADNAHGVHPNYVEKQDPTNHPALGGGPVIKINANCKYMTDADSAAVYRTVCEAASVPVQYFVNHSDVAGGSTLGNILTSQLPLRGVDMGAALWAMHSVRETASVADHDYIIRSFVKFYEI